MNYITKFAILYFAAHMVLWAHRDFKIRPTIQIQARAR